MKAIKRIITPRVKTTLPKNSELTLRQKRNLLRSTNTG